MGYDSDPSDGGDMRDLQPPPPSGPSGEQPEKSGGVTTIGILNLLFGFTCGCGGLMFAALLLALPGLLGSWQKMMEQGMAQARAQIVVQVDVANEELAAAETARDAVPADDPNAAQLQQDVDDAQANVVQLDKQVKQFDDLNFTEMFDSMTGMFKSPGMMAYNYTNAGTMCLINLLYIISGFGILKRREWGRTLALGTAGTKIGLEVILAIIAVAVMPALMQDYFDSLQSMMEKMPGGSAQAQQFQNMQNMGTQMVFQTVIGALMFMVYPVCVLVVMIKRTTKQEFTDWANYYAAGGR